jgi:preprotein translocase subunit YajC
VLFHGIFFFSKRKKKHTKKKDHREENICRERRELTFKLPFCPLTFGSHFCCQAFELLFQMLCCGIFFFSSIRKEKKHKEKKIIKKKKNVEKGGSLPSSSRFTLSFLVLAFAFHFKCILLAFSSFKPKKKTQKKKTIEKKKMQKREGAYFFFSCFCIWDEALLLLSPLHILSMLSFPPSSSFVSMFPQSSMLFNLESSLKL